MYCASSDCELSRAVVKGLSSAGLAPYVQVRVRVTEGARKAEVTFWPISKISGRQRYEFCKRIWVAPFSKYESTTCFNPSGSAPRKRPTDESAS